MENNSRFLIDTTIMEKIKSKNIKIKTNLVPPQKYKFASEEVEIVGTENKLRLIVDSYEWENKLEYTYAIRGYNIYFSEIGFKTYEEAEKEGKEKLNEYIQSVCEHKNIKNECEFPYGHRKVCQDCEKDFTN